MFLFHFFKLFFQSRFILNFKNCLRILFFLLVLKNCDKKLRIPKLFQLFKIALILFNNDQFFAEFGFCLVSTSLHYKCNRMVDNSVPNGVVLCLWVDKGLQFNNESIWQIRKWLQQLIFQQCKSNFTMKINHSNLSAQYWPNLLCGQFNNTLQVTVL